MNPYLALLRVEFTVPRTVTSRAVRSYRTLSPLPDPACAGHRRFALCCTGRGFPPQALPGTLPYGARTFLPSARLPRRGRRRSGDCLVSFGAQYRGFARPCHPALRIPKTTGRRMSSTCSAVAFIRKSFVAIGPEDFRDYIDERLQSAEPATVDRELDVFRAVGRVRIFV